MNWYLIIRFLHIFSSIVFIGGILARQVIRSQGKKSGDINTLVAYFSAAGKIESLMVIPGNFATILFGVIFAVMIKAPIFGFLQGADKNWLLLTNVLLVLGSLNVPLVFLPRGKMYEKLLADAIQKGEVTLELKTHLDDKLVKAAHQFEILMLVVIVLLMVFKPF